MSNGRFAKIGRLESEPAFLLGRFGNKRIINIITTTANAAMIAKVIRQPTN